MHPLVAMVTVTMQRMLHVLCISLQLLSCGTQRGRRYICVQPRHSEEQVLNQTREAGVDGARGPFRALMAVGSTWITCWGDRRWPIPDHGEYAAG